MIPDIEIRKRKIREENNRYDLGEEKTRKLDKKTGQILKK